MKHRRNARINPTQMYKGFIIVPRGAKQIIYDIAGRVYTEAATVREAWEKIDARIRDIVDRRKAPAKKNPGYPQPGSTEWLKAKSTGPIWEYEDARGVKHIGYQERFVDRGGHDVSYFMRDRDTGELSVVSGSRIKTMNLLQQNPSILYRHGKAPKQVKNLDWLGDTVEIGGNFYAQKKPLMSNPLTRAETRNLQSEARIHARIGRTPKQKAYYRGMAEGMKDAAEQYGKNPPLNLDRMNESELMNLIHEIGNGVRPIKQGEKMFGRIPGAMQAAKDYRNFAWNKLTAMRNPESAEMYLMIADKIYNSLPAFAKWQREKKNPPVEVYDRIKEVIAVKGPGHRCDAACRRAGHTYRHKFTSRAGIYGNPNGTLTIKSH